MNKKKSLSDVIAGNARDARRGAVACEHSDTPLSQEVGCICEWGCWIAQGSKAKPKHQRLQLNWRCHSDHDLEGSADYRLTVLAKEPAPDHLAPVVGPIGASK